MVVWEHVSQCVLLTDFYLSKKNARCHAPQTLEITVVKSHYPDDTEMDLHVAVVKLKNIDSAAGHPTPKQGVITLDGTDPDFYKPLPIVSAYRP